MRFHGLKLGMVCKLSSSEKELFVYFNYFVLVGKIETNDEPLIEFKVKSFRQISMHTFQFETVEGEFMEWSPKWGLQLLKAACSAVDWCKYPMYKIVPGSDMIYTWSESNTPVVCTTNFVSNMNSTNSGTLFTPNTLIMLGCDSGAKNLYFSTFNMNIKEQEICRYSLDSSAIYKLQIDSLMTSEMPEYLLEPAIYSDETNTYIFIGQICQDVWGVYEFCIIRESIRMVHLLENPTVKLPTIYHLLNRTTALQIVYCTMSRAWSPMSLIRWRIA